MIYEEGPTLCLIYSSLTAICPLYILCTSVTHSVFYVHNIYIYTYIYKMSRGTSNFQLCTCVSFHFCSSNIVMCMLVSHFEMLWELRKWSEANICLDYPKKLQSWMIFCVLRYRGYIPAWGCLDRNSKEMGRKRQFNK